MVEASQGGGLDRFDVAVADRCDVRLPRLDDFEPAPENRFDRNFAVHGIVRHGLDPRENFRAAHPREFVDALDGAERAVAVEEDPIHRGE